MTGHLMQTESKRSSIRSFTRRTLPSQAAYSNDLCAIVMSDTKRTVEEIKTRSAGMPYEVLQHVENRLLHQYRRARQIAECVR